MKTTKFPISEREVEMKEYDKALRIALLPLLGAHERALINRRLLTKVRHSARMVFFETDWIHQKYFIEYQEARFWYRTMTREHFNYLVNTNMVNVNGENDYGGIAPTFKYCEHPKYFGNEKSGTHIVEFELYCTGEELCKEIQERDKESTGKKFALSHPKSEGGITSIGLGPKGYYKGTAGKYFNEKLLSGAIKWKLAKFRIANPIADHVYFY
jgi:hypothetical protein